MKPLLLSQIFPLPWYDRAQWERLREVAVDPQELDASFDAWELQAVQTETEFLARGYDVRRIAITVDALVAWCKANKRRLDRAARSAYVQHLNRSAKAGG